VQLQAVRDGGVDQLEQLISQATRINAPPK
jgi:hypothetical protein